MNLMSNKEEDNSNRADLINEYIDTLEDEIEAIVDNVIAIRMVVETVSDKLPAHLYRGFKQGVVSYLKYELEDSKSEQEQ